MRAAILRLGILLTLAVLGTSAATAQTELFFATGVDSTGWAQAQSNADGHVLIESPQYPCGLWLHLVDEAGDALTGIQVEYQGRADSLVAIHCVDPTGGVRETLVWTRPSVGSLLLTLKPKEAADLPAGLVPIDWQIDPSVGSLLEPVEETRLVGWEAVAAFLRERWQGQTGRVAIQLDANTSFAVELGHPKAIETLVARLQQAHQPAAAPLGETTPLEVQVLEGSLGLREGLILSTYLFKDAALETAVRQTLGRPHGRLTPEDIASLTELFATNSTIHSLTGLKHFTALQQLGLDNNQIADLTPLAGLTNLYMLMLRNNQIADVTPLAGLTNLNYLDLQSNQITDVTPLANLTNLQWLRLWDNQIADVTPLADLTNLNYLDLDTNQITDVTPLAGLTKLNELDLRTNQIADVTPLAGLTNLHRLHLQSNQIADVTPLAGLTNLNYLDISNNRIEDLSPLVANTGLGGGDIVHLQSNPLSDQALTEQIPALKARGVEVSYNPPLVPLLGKALP